MSLDHIDEQVRQWYEVVASTDPLKVKSILARHGQVAFKFADLTWLDVLAVGGQVLRAIFKIRYQNLHLSLVNLLHQYVLDVQIIVNQSGVVHLFQAVYKSNANLARRGYTELLPELILV